MNYTNIGCESAWALTSNRAKEKKRNQQIRRQYPPIPNSTQNFLHSTPAEYIILHIARIQFNHLAPVSSDQSCQPCRSWNRPQWWYTLAAGRRRVWSRRHSWVLAFGRLGVGQRRGPRWDRWSQNWWRRRQRGWGRGSWRGYRRWNQTLRGKYQRQRMYVPAVPMLYQETNEVPRPSVGITHPPATQE